MMALTILEDFIREAETSARKAATDAWNLLNTRDLAESLPPVPWLCEPIGMAPGAVSLVAGYGYSRKTMALQSLALSVAAGRPLWGVYSVRSGPVVHLDYEQGRRLTQERYQRLARGMGFELEDLADDSLRVACMPRIYLETQEAIDSLMPVVAGAAFVVVDSLRAAFPHADENSSDVRSYLDALNHVSERTGATIAVIHHARKPSAQQGGTATHAIRGSSALFDACQSVYVFEGEKDTATTVHHQKDRIRGATCPEFGITSEDVPGPTGARWGLRVVHMEGEQMAEGIEARRQAKEAERVERTKAAVKAALLKLGGTFQGTRNDLVALVGGDRTAAQRAVSALLATNEITSEGRGGEREWSLV
jgi:RecA-family ATPase